MKSREFLRSAALRALEGIGDESLGQWEEWNAAMQTYHIRRRLTSAEQAETGDLIDIRGTAEQDKRWRAVMKYLPAAYRHWKD